MDFLCDIFHLDFIHVIVFQIIHDLTHTVAFQFAVFRIGEVLRKILQHTTPQLLQRSGDIQFVKFLFLFIQSYDFSHIFGKNFMPGLRIVNVDCRNGEIV